MANANRTRSCARAAIVHLCLMLITLTARDANSNVPCRPKYVIAEGAGETALVLCETSNAFTYQDNVLAVIGSIDGANTHVALRVALKPQTPMVNTGTTDPTLTETAIPWILRCMADDRQQGYALAHHIFNERGIKKVAAFRVNDRFGRTGTGEFRDAARRLGHPLRVELRWDRGDHDFTTQLDRIAQTGANAVVPWGNAVDTAAVVREMRRRNMPHLIFGCDRLASERFLKEAKSAARGVVAVATFDPTNPHPRCSEFIKAFKQRFGRQPGAFGAHAYDGANILIESIRQAGFNRVRDALHTYRRYEGATGLIQFDVTQNDIGPVYIATVKDGSFVYHRAEFWKTAKTDARNAPYRRLEDAPPVLRVANAASPPQAMHPGSSNEDVGQVVDLLHHRGADGFVIPKLAPKTVEVLGDTRNLDRTMLKNMPMVERIVDGGDPILAAGREPHDATYEVPLGNGESVGGKRIAMIAGPCSVESLDQIVETAIGVKEAGAVALRGGAFKPRTSPYSFQGHGEEALEMLACAREKTGLSIITEVMRCDHVELVAKYADVLQIGSRNMHQTHLLVAVGEQDKPVLLKRGWDATLKEFLLAAEYIMLHGNRNVILCERGIRSYETYVRNTLALAIVPEVKRVSRLPIIVDPSHGTGQSHLVGPMSNAAIACGADGLMIEVHRDPPSAWTDASQTLTLDQFQTLSHQAHAFAQVVDRTI